MTKISDLIQAAKDEVVEPKTGSHTVAVAGKVIELVFTRLDPMAWRDLVAVFPPRAKVARDMNLGYNYDLVPAGYPVDRIRLLLDGEELETSQDEWRELFGVLESPDLFAISTLLWGMHEWEPQQNSKKALGASKRK